MNQPDQPAQSAATGEIPQSSALAEAIVESLTELMSRDPEGYTKQDRMRIIATQREARARWEQMEKEEQASGKPKIERTKADAVAILKRASGKAEDLDL